MESGEVTKRSRPELLRQGRGLVHLHPGEEIVSKGASVGWSESGADLEAEDTMVEDIDTPLTRGDIPTIVNAVLRNLTSEGRFLLFYGTERLFRKIQLISQYLKNLNLP